MSERDEELSAWAAAWRHPGQPQGIDPTVIRREVRRRTWRLGVAAALELAMLGAMLVFLLLFASATADLWDLAVVAAFSALILVAALRRFAALHRTWRAHTETTRGFVDLMIVRAETRLRQVRFGWAILLVEVTVFVPWIAHTLRPPSAGMLAAAYGFLATVVAIAVVMLRLLRRHARRDLHRWRALRAEVSD